MSVEVKSGSLEEIEKHIVNIKFKTSLFGGLKRMDVYQQIQNIHTMYSAYTEELVSRCRQSEDEIADLEEKLERAKEKNAELKKLKKETKSSKYGEYEQSGNERMHWDDVKYQAANILNSARREANRIIRDAEREAKEEASKIRTGILYGIRNSDLSGQDFSEKKKELVEMLALAEMELKDVQRHVETVKKQT